MSLPKKSPNLLAGKTIWTSILPRLFSLFFKGPWRSREILKLFATITWDGMPVIIFTTAFSGMILMETMAWHMRFAVGDVSLIPGFSAQFVLRELGVAIPALLLVSKVGASMTAEIATMKVTEQLDALKVLRVDWIEYLVFPRWIATTISAVVLGLMAVVSTIAASMLLAVFKYGFNALEFLTRMQSFVGGMDFVCLIVKSTLFGMVIPIVACAFGVHSRPGAEGVGLATTQSVVASMVTIIFLDFVLTALFVPFL